MNRMKFSAQELYVLAAAAKKEKMYGLPDGFSWMPEEEMPVAHRQIADALLDEGVLVMDFDGKTSVAAEYVEMVNVYCDCSKCLTLNRQKENGVSEDKIFWQYNERMYCAEAQEDDYVFHTVSGPEIQADLAQEKWTSVGAAGMETVIPQIALTKAKRYAIKEKTEEALRILKQNGADNRTAAVLYDGLREKAQYLGLLLMDMSSGTCEKTEKAWLNGRGVIYSMGKTVVNLRTCTVFTEVEREAVSQDIEKLAAAFFRRE